MTKTRSSSHLLRAAILRMGLGLPLIALLLIWPSGKWDYWQGWMYIGTLFIPMFFVLGYLFKNDPALLERRLHLREKEAAQRKIIGASFVYFIVLFVLPGLDVRFGWSNVPPLVSIAADVLVFAGYMVFVWVMLVNSFLSRVVEVAAEQKVITSGPYAIVRHPMYFGLILMFVATPLALGSYWTLPLAVLIVPLLAARIRNEEQVLLRELPGYPEYTQKVKYRLLPGVW